MNERERERSVSSVFRLTAKFLFNPSIGRFALLQSRVAAIKISNRPSMYANTERSPTCAHHPSVYFTHTRESIRGKRYNKRSNRAGVSFALPLSSGSTLYKLMCSYANPCYDYVPASRFMYTRVLSLAFAHATTHITRT